MKQVIIKKGGVVVENVPAPVVGEGMLLIKNLFSTISVGTEVSSIKNTEKPLWKRAIENPDEAKKALKIIADQGLIKTTQFIKGRLDAGNAVGYSSSGVILEVGKGVTGFNIGDKVACAGAGYASHAEYITVPSNLVLPVNDSIDMAHASTVALGAIAMQGVRRANVTLGETIVVFGLGIMGQIVAQLLKNNGCFVIGIDIDPNRGKLAESLGLDYFINASNQQLVEETQKKTGGNGADGIIITAASSSSEIISQSFEMCRKKGRVVLVGSVGLDLNRADFYKKEIDFLISTSYGPGRYDPNYEEKGLDYPIGYVRWTEKRNMELYLGMIAAGRVNVEPLVHKIYDIDEAPAAYSSLRNKDNKPLMVILKYADYHPAAKEYENLNLIKNPTPKKQNKDAPIKLAVIGAGGFAKGVHLPNIEALSSIFHLHTVIDRKGHNAQSTARQFKAEYSGTRPTDVFNNDDVDAVVITTRHNTHAELTLEALRAGKHVLVEKPMILNQQELNDIVLYFQQSKREYPILLTGFNRRFSPHMRAIKEIIGGRTSPMIISYTMNAGYKPLENWVHSSEGGGRNIGEACHIYDLFTFLTDAEAIEIKAFSISPQAGYYSPRDNFIANITFADGSIASLTYTSLGNNKYPKEVMDIYTDGKIVHLADFKSVDYYGISNKKNRRSKRAEKGHKEELQEFARSIQNSTEWPIPLWQQIQAMKIALDVENYLH